MRVVAWFTSFTQSNFATLRALKLNILLQSYYKVALRGLGDSRRDRIVRLIRDDALPRLAKVRSQGTDSVLMYFFFPERW